MRLIVTILSALLLLMPATQAQDDAGYDPYADMIISDDLGALPEPVRLKHEQLVEATRTGDIESLRAIIAAQDSPPNVSFGLPDDPVAYLKEQSADPEGRQILALLRNLLEMPYAVLGASSETPNYVWPYLALADIENLTPEQSVDAFRLVTPEDLENMRQFGGWFWWRVYIGADGEWRAFVAGD